MGTEVKRIRISVESKAMIKFLNWKFYTKEGIYIQRDWLNDATQKQLKKIQEMRYEYISPEDKPKRHITSIAVSTNNLEALHQTIENRYYPIRFLGHLFELIIYLTAKEVLNEQEKEVSGFYKWKVEYVSRST